MRLMRWMVLVLVALPLLAGCTSVQNAQNLDTSNSPVIFRLGTTSHTAADFTQRLDRDIGPAIADLLAQGQTPEQIEQLANDNNVRVSIFDQMVQDALLSRYARQHGIGVNPTTVDEAVFAEATPAEDSPLLITADQRVRTAQNQLVFEVIARNTRADQVHARHILLNDEASADQVLADLAAGADFATLARERSQDPVSAAEGGDLGWATRGSYVPEFEEVAFSAELNTPTKVQSQFGWHVIDVLEREEDRPFESFESLRRSSNAQQYYQDTFVPWYEELRREAENSGDLEITPNFDPNSVPLPFPQGAP